MESVVTTLMMDLLTPVSMLGAIVANVDMLVGYAMLMAGLGAATDNARAIRVTLCRRTNPTAPRSTSVSSPP